MAISSKYRWIAVGSMNVRNHANAPLGAEDFSLEEVVAACRQRIEDESEHRLYSADSKLMWISDVDENAEFYILLVHTADKNVAGMSLVDFQTMDARDIEKAEEEGGLYSSHVLIKKDADENERNQILVEKVPGVYLGSIKDHLTWVCKHPTLHKVAHDDEGNLKSYRAIFEIDGYQSRTISEAIAGGTLKDVEFVSIEEENVDGLDEEPLIEEIIHEAKWSINKKVPEDRINPLFSWLREQRPTDNSKMFVRIKTEAGQIKTTEIDPDNDQMLEAAFIQNEFVSDFDEPLGARHAEIRGDLVQKMSVKAN